MELTELFTRFSVNYGAEWVMWLLIALSGVSFYLIIDRTIFFLRNRTNAASLSRDLSQLLARGELKGLAPRLAGEKGVVARIVDAGVQEAEHGHLAAEQAIGGEKTRQRLRCERNLAVLATIGNNAPFVGLFGTVIGVLVAFHRFSDNTTGGAGAIMADISEALAATAIGLFVAIPAVAAFNVFQRQTKGMLSTGDAIASLLLTFLRSQASGDRQLLEGDTGRGRSSKEK
jgi:biopolymer transport protein ExbB